jgi:hypothetical protein
LCGADKHNGCASTHHQAKGPLFFSSFANILRIWTDVIKKQHFGVRNSSMLNDKVTEERERERNLEDIQ